MTRRVWVEFAYLAEPHSRCRTYELIVGRDS